MKPDYSVKDIVSLRLQEIAAERGITMNKMAREAGISPSTIYSITDPTRRDISLSTLKIILDGLDISLGEFFSHPYFMDLDQEMK